MVSLINTLKSRWILQADFIYKKQHEAERFDKIIILE
jgi:hypothetical protein